jgi:hypothetical protein
MERTSDKSPESQESATGLYTGQKWIIENRPQISPVSAELYGYIVLGNNTPVQRVLRQLRKK